MYWNIKDVIGNITKVIVHSKTDYNSIDSDCCLCQKTPKIKLFIATRIDIRLHPVGDSILYH